MTKTPINFFWFRRDLRLDDNAGLYHALKSAQKSQGTTIPVFIFDTNILSKLTNKEDKRVDFIWQQINNLQSELTNLGSNLLVFHGHPEIIWNKIIKEYSQKHEITGLFFNRDYEPATQNRDKAINALFSEQQIPVSDFKDHLIFDRAEITKPDQTPYTIYTPYMKKWRTQLSDFYLESYPSLSYQQYLHKNWHLPTATIPSLTDLGFQKTNTIFPDKTPAITTIQTYDQTRDYPHLDFGTSKLGLHLRFGTISIRKLATFALKTNQTFLNELIWREFFSQILFHYPHVQTKAFKAQYDKIQWQNDLKLINAWKNGKTGYPIIDAGMRELNATGHMHNRVRMIVASFLVKDLLCDWRIGEAYFAEKLLDYDLASNNGNWQWAAGTGCDAAPYFRIFNPELQTKRFDPELKYIKKWVPELESPNYPSPIVDHKLAKNRCLEAYKEALTA